MFVILTVVLTKMTKLLYINVPGGTQMRNYCNKHGCIPVIAIIPGIPIKTIRPVMGQDTRGISMVLVSFRTRNVWGIRVPPPRNGEEARLLKYPEALRRGRRRDEVLKGTGKRPD